MEVTLQTREFIRKVLGVPVLVEPYAVKRTARELLLYLEPAPTPDRWMIILFNPELRAELVAALLYINKDDDDLSWSLLFTNLEDLLEKKTREAMGIRVDRDLHDTGTVHEAVAIFHEAFRHIGRDVASKFTSDLLTYVATHRGLVKKIKRLAAVS